MQVQTRKSEYLFEIKVKRHFILIEPWLSFFKFTKSDCGYIFFDFRSYYTNIYYPEGNLNF